VGLPGVPSAQEGAAWYFIKHLSLLERSEFVVTAEQLLTNKDLREKLIARLEVLDKVKQVVTMSNTELMTVEQVADYYEVGVDVNRNATLFDVLSDDEVIKAFQSALALCKEAEIDVSKVLAKVETGA